MNTLYGNHIKIDWNTQEIPLSADFTLWGVSSWHHDRKIAHTASFIALAKLFYQQEPDTQTVHPKQTFSHWFNNEARQILKEESYYKIWQTNLLCSRSHTHTKTAAALTPLTNDCLSIGIDIESINRPIKPELLKFYIHKNDDQELDPLQLWSLKEAAYKAISSYLLFHQIELSKALTLKDIFINSDGRYMSDHPELAATLFGNCQLLTDQSDYISLASLTRLM